MLDTGLDGHIHTWLCNHASGEMEDYIQAAIHCGLHTIIFLEHLEIDIRYDQRTWLEPEHFELYFEQGKQLQAYYKDKIEVKLGVEIGYNPHSIDAINSVLASYPFEWRGLSYHFYLDGRRHYNMVSRRPENVESLAEIGVDRVIDAYFDGLIDGVKRIECDVLCHLDAVMRHYPNLRFTSSHMDKIDQLLELLAKKNIKLECNTSGFSIRGEQYPQTNILNRAAKLGIPLIPGSDAHRPEQVGRHFDQLAEFTA